MTSIKEVRMIGKGMEACERVLTKAKELSKISKIYIMSWNDTTPLLSSTPVSNL
jgi:hypothetical protein